MNGEKSFVALDAKNTHATQLIEQAHLLCAFVSHSTKDQGFVQRLVNDLGKYGVRTWVAPRDILPGEQWNEAIERGIKGATHFLLVLSPDSVVSRWVEIEMAMAISQERAGKLHIIPILYKPCDVPLMWQTYHVIKEFSQDYQRGFSHLLQVLRRADPQILNGRDDAPENDLIRVLRYVKCLDQMPLQELADLARFIHERPVSRSAVDLASEFVHYPKLYNRALMYLRKRHDHIASCLEQE